MISSVGLVSFKKFKDNVITLKPFSILMGENSCGKTTILQAINLALCTIAGSELIANKTNGNISVRLKGVGATSLPGINISDFRELYYAKVSRQGKQGKIDDSKIGARITLQDDANNNYRLQVSSLFGGFNLKCVSSSDDLKNNPSLHLYSPLFISGFVGLQETEQRSFPVTIRHFLSSGNVSSIIRNLVLDLKKNNPVNYELLCKRLANDFDFHLGDVDFNEQKDEFLKATYREQCDDKRLSFDFNSSGSGYMQILQILAPIYTVCPASCKVVLLDEPDAHLHPNMQIALARSLKRIQKELNIQIIISTHSPAIIKTALPTEVIPVCSSTIKNMPLTSENEVSDCIAQLDNYELAKSVISGKMVFIEDSNTEILEAIDKIADTKVFFGANTVSIHTGRSKDDKIPFLIKPLLKEFLGKDIEIHFVRDSDGLNKTWVDSLLRYAEEKDIHLHLLKRYEIENYVLNSNLIFRALKKKYINKPLPSINEIECKIKKYLKETIEMNRYKYNDTLEDGIFKTAILLQKPEYRDQNHLKSEAEKIRRKYEEFTDIDELLIVGMGKETRKLLMRWLNDEKGLNICKDDILDSLEPEDIPEELQKMLLSLRSDISPQQDINTLVDAPEETLDDDIPVNMTVDGMMQLRLFN